MPHYRIEASPTSRAGCKDKVCQDNKVKIIKGELRFGIWVESETITGWMFKHWGCVSGQQLENIQEFIRQGDGSYDFDMIDGYDELNDYPEHQAKIRIAVEQGHIALKDFNGDPGKCVPGARGIRFTAIQKEKMAKDAGKSAAAEHRGSLPGKSKGKRGRKNDEEEEENHKSKRAKKPSAIIENEDDEAPSNAHGHKSAVKPESKDEEMPVPAKAAPKKVRKSAVKKEGTSEESHAPANALAKRERGSAVKDEIKEPVQEPTPIKKERKSRSKAVKKKSEQETEKKTAPVKEEETEETTQGSIPVKKGRRINFKSIKDECAVGAEEEVAPVKKGRVSAATAKTIGEIGASVKRDRKPAVKEAHFEAEEDESMTDVEEEKLVPKPKATSKKGHKSAATEKFLLEAERVETAQDVEEEKLVAKVKANTKARRGTKTEAARFELVDVTHLRRGRSRNIL